MFFFCRTHHVRSMRDLDGIMLDVGRVGRGYMRTGEWGELVVKGLNIAV